jgi:hypothetical protein
MRTLWKSGRARIDNRERGFQIKDFVEFVIGWEVLRDGGAPSLVRVLHNVHLKEY